MEYKNTPTVVAVIVPTVDNGVVVVKRKDGGWALPGGFQEYMEKWQDTGIREVWEETKQKITDIKLLELHTVEVNLILSISNKIEFDAFVDIDDDETEEIKVIHSPIDLKFPLHNTILKQHFFYKGLKRF